MTAPMPPDSAMSYEELEERIAVLEEENKFLREGHGTIEVAPVTCFGLPLVEIHRLIRKEKRAPQAQGAAWLQLIADKKKP